MSDSDVLLLLAVIPGVIALVLAIAGAVKMNLPYVGLAVIALAASVFLAIASTRVG